MMKLLNLVEHAHLAVPIALAILLLVLILNRRKYSEHNPRRLPYPPGPQPLPLLGNFFDIPRTFVSGPYQKLANQHGDLVFLRTLGNSILLVSSFKAANELFEKRSINYSDRFQSPMSLDLMGWDFSFAHMMYGDEWKKHRRVFHSQFQPSIVPSYQPIQTKAAHALLRRFLNYPDKLDYNLRQNAAALVMEVAYGIKIAETGDSYVSIAEKALEGASKSATPGGFLVDFLPFMKYVPEWVPKAIFKRQAREWREAVTEMKNAPFERVVDELRSGIAPPSFVSILLSNLETKDSLQAQDEVTVIKNCAAVVYAASAESTVSTLATFVLAMLVYPDIQEKAQKELDSVVGRDRLPEFSDRPSLPYITAILKEVLRWSPVAPLGLPHRTTMDDEYEGYFIPAGTIVIGNAWGILNDPELYPEPRRFNPERFMGEGDKGQQHLSPTDPLSVAFGYGRRVCPGRNMAEANVWISIASILSAFEISPAFDEMGLPIKVTPEFSKVGMICHPLPFDFTLKPRSASAKALIEQTEFE